MAVLTAPAAWRTVDFISDLHLSADEPATAAAWRRYLVSTPADAVFILGDLFEVWIGDDAAQSGSFEAQCAQALLSVTRSKPIFFMPGNRDFLLGSAFLRQSGMTALADPTVLACAGQRWLLTHGDALCVADTDYMAFRTKVRSPEWQTNFLNTPLQERKDFALGVRYQRELRKKTLGPDHVYADVDSTLALAWLAAVNSRHMIHGHTHRPASHALGVSCQCSVLSDWDVTASPARAEVLRLRLTGNTGTLERIGF